MKYVETDETRALQMFGLTIKVQMWFC